MMADQDNTNTPDKTLGSTPNLPVLWKDPNEDKDKGGRPELEINDTIIEQARQLAAAGLTIEEIAYSLNMGASTLYAKKARFSELEEAIKTGQAQGVARIANRLFQKADSGDNTAMIFYLKARGGWRDNVDVHHHGISPIVISSDDADL